LSNKPFHVCIGEIQVFVDGPIGNPKKCLLCVVAVDFVASSCTSQIYKRTANSLSVRSVAVFQKQIKKRKKQKEQRRAREGEVEDQKGSCPGIEDWLRRACSRCEL
jgi:Ni/Co efflux regulator RcnB